MLPKNNFRNIASRGRQSTRGNRNGWAAPVPCHVIRQTLEQHCPDILYSTVQIWIQSASRYFCHRGQKALPALQLFHEAAHILSIESAARHRCVRTSTNTKVLPPTVVGAGQRGWEHEVTATLQ